MFEKDGAWQLSELKLLSKSKVSDKLAEV